MLPIRALQSPIDAHRWDITIGAAESAVARRGKRVREPGLGNEAGRRGQNPSSLGIIDGKAHTSILVDRPSQFDSARTRARRASPLHPNVSWPACRLRNDWEWAREQRTRGRRGCAIRASTATAPHAAGCSPPCSTRAARCNGTLRRIRRRTFSLTRGRLPGRIP
jgi:hypothetical protein